jgi:hypothetical protein
VNWPSLVKTAGLGGIVIFVFEAMVSEGEVVASKKGIFPYLYTSNSRSPYPFNESILTEEK